MKVLKKRNPKKWKHENECTGHGNGGHGCGSLLELKTKDVVYWPGVDGEGIGSKDPAMSFKCPVCGTISDLCTMYWPKDPKQQKEVKEVTADWYKE